MPPKQANEQCQCTWSAELQSKYKIGESIGRGSYGCVHAGEDSHTGEKVAIKKIKKIFDSDKKIKKNVDSSVSYKRLLREIKLLRMAKGHPFLTSLKHIETPTNPADFDEVDLVFERYEANLEEIIQSPQPLSTEHVQYFLYQILCGVKFLHSAHVLHRDLKPENILINEDCAINICDFGLARATKRVDRVAAEVALHASADAASSSSSSSSSSSLSSTSQPSAPPPLVRQLTPHVTTRWYRSPEVILLSKNYGPPVDMWSVGCILAALLTRRPLFPGKSCYPLSDLTPSLKDQSLLIFDLIGTPPKEDLNGINRVVLAEFPHVPRKDFKKVFSGIDPAAVDLLEKLLVFDPAKRYTAAQALDHPFLSDYKYNEEIGYTFPLKKAANTPPDVLTEDKTSRLEYYEIESKFAAGEKYDPALARQRVLQEIERYNVKSKNTSVSTSSVSATSVVAEVSVVSEVAEVSLVSKVAEVSLVSEVAEVSEASKVSSSSSDSSSITASGYSFFQTNQQDQSVQASSQVKAKSPAYAT